MISQPKIPRRPLQIIYYGPSIRHYCVADADYRLLSSHFTRRGAERKLEKLSATLVSISLYNKRRG